ncbi:uncharacterized protein [Nicotiana sylvestris]|uniref:uncharacterized protein n=1 Tax=Nicotiana sylvestris TaxID=4096 RepID=UPI00388C3694
MDVELKLELDEEDEGRRGEKQLKQKRDQQQQCEMYPSVYHLQLHLKGQQFVSFKATVRSKGCIALATATSGVAASTLPSGRTAHSHFKIPIDIEENFSCNINKQSSTTDLMDTNILFGGKVVVFGDDFRQTLLVIRNKKKEDFIGIGLMRAKTDPSFCDYLMRIGIGQERVNTNNKIELSDSIIITFTTEEESLDHLFVVTVSNVHTCSSNPFFADSRIVLTTKNNFVNEINDILIAKFPEKATTFVGFDETVA